MKHIQSESELRGHFDDHLRFIQSSADAFDNGFESEAKRMAASIRVLVHDTKNSHSLLKQLSISTPFYDSSVQVNPENVASHIGLLGMRLSQAKGEFYYAPLDEVSISDANTVDFDAWWNAIVFVDQKKNEFSRRQVVLSVAEQDGGAHVDPSLNAAYSDLSRNNSLGWMHVSAGQEATPVEGPEKMAVRQIAHEVLKTFVPGYSKLPNLEGAAVLMRQMEIRPATEEEIAQLKASQQQEIARRQQAFFDAITRENKQAQLRSQAQALYGRNKVGRNEKCPCGSGDKYKKCCGRTSGTEY